VIAGTATAVSGRVAHRQQQRYMEEEAQAAGAYYPAAQEPSVAEPDYMQELQDLARLRDQGVLTEDEFQAKKKQLLGL
jgi:hypothetical protein